MRKNGIVGGRSVLEGLENRQLLSTVDVADFGAVADDGRDDRGAIVAAINASKPGDTVKLVGGTFNVSDEITLSPDRTYAGTKSPSSPDAAAKARSSNSKATTSPSAASPSKAAASSSKDQAVGSIEISRSPTASSNSMRPACIPAASRSLPACKTRRSRTTFSPVRTVRASEFTATTTTTSRSRTTSS